MVETNSYYLRRYSSGKGYKTISKEVGQMEDIQHHCYPLQEWFGQQRSHQRYMLRKLKAFLTVATVNIHESTLRRTLNINGELKRESHNNTIQYNNQHFVLFGDEQTLHSNIRTSSHVGSKVVGLLCYL